MELIFFISEALVILVSVYTGYRMGKGEKILEIPKKMGKSVKTEAQQAEIEKKVMEPKEIRRALNG